MAKPKPLRFVVRKSSPFNGKEWRVVGYEGKNRKQFWFATEKEAKKDAADRNQQRSAYGSELNLDASLRFEALKAADLLRPFDKSLLDAVIFYTDHLAKAASSITVGELCDRVGKEFDRRKASGEASTRHYTSMTETLRRFNEKFRSSPLDSSTEPRSKPGCRKPRGRRKPGTVTSAISKTSSGSLGSGS